MHRVVVTGIGAVSPLGLTAEESWQSALKGQTGVGPVTLFDASNFPVKLAAEVKNFEPEKYLDRKEVRRQDRFELLAAVAALEAIQQSGASFDTEEGSLRTGVAISSGVGGLQTIIEQVLILDKEGPRKLSPFAIPRLMSNGAAGLVSILHGLRGPSFSVASACASSSDGIGIALQMLRAGMADTMIGGGSEAGVSNLGLGSFHRIGAYSERLDCTPAPFSADRDGLIMGEGAAILILETLEHAKRRAAPILAELVGYGASADAFHVTAPTEDGSGSSIAIRRALDDARLNAEDIDYINAHGTGTPLNDTAETNALKGALGEQAYRIPISSTKSMTGHMMGATGALEAVFSIHAIRDNAVPPTINYTERDPACDLDYIPNQARELPVRVVMSNSFGFGGHNSVLIFKEFED